MSKVWGGLGGACMNSFTSWRGKNKKKTTRLQHDIITCGEYILVTVHDALWRGDLIHEGHSSSMKGRDFRALTSSSVAISMGVGGIWEARRREYRYTCEPWMMCGHCTDICSILLINVLATLQFVKWILCNPLRCLHTHTIHKCFHRVSPSQSKRQLLKPRLVFEDCSI